MSERCLEVQFRLLVPPSLPPPPSFFSSLYFPASFPFCIPLNLASLSSSSLLPFPLFYPLFSCFSPSLPPMIHPSLHLAYPCSVYTSPFFTVLLLRVAANVSTTHLSRNVVDVCDVYTSTFNHSCEHRFFIFTVLSLTAYNVSSLYS